MSHNINFYDPALRKRLDVLGFEFAIGMVAAAALLVAVGAGLARWSLARIEPVAASMASELQAQQAAMQATAARNASGKPDASLQAEVAQTQRTLLQRQAALQAIDGGGAGREGGFAGRLEALARQSIDGLWLTGMTLHQDHVLLRGRAVSPALIPSYVQRLEREPSLQGRTFKALEVSRPLEASAKTVATAAAATGTEAAPIAARAEFVEFTLTGASDRETLLAAKETPP